MNSTPGTPGKPGSPGKPGKPGPDIPKGPNGLMIFSAILMVPGLLLTGFILIREMEFLSINYNFATGSDTVVGFITAILLLMEICYIVLVLQTKLRVWTYEPRTMKNLAIWMLILNCVLFVYCSICMQYFEGWTPQGYFTLADVLVFVSIPGIIVKILAFKGACDCAGS